MWGPGLNSGRLRIVVSLQLALASSGRPQVKNAFPWAGEFPSNVRRFAVVKPGTPVWRTTLNKAVNWIMSALDTQRHVPIRLFQKSLIVCIF